MKKCPKFLLRPIYPLFGIIYQIHQFLKNNNDSSMSQTYWKSQRKNKSILNIFNVPIEAFFQFVI